MIFGRFKEYPKFRHLLQFLRNKYSYPSLEYGQQCDDWIWIHQDGSKLQIDNFTSFDLEIKCSNKSAPIIKEVTNYLATEYELELYSEPEYEAHEDEPEG